jgi:hypothetical protein
MVYIMKTTADTLLELEFQVIIQLQFSYNLEPEQAQTQFSYNSHIEAHIYNYIAHTYI